MRAVSLLALVSLVSTVSAAGFARRMHRGMQQHHKNHGKAHQVPLVHHGWSMPPLTKLFRGSEKTAGSLESNMARLKASVADLRKKDLDDAKEVYAGYAQALGLDDEQNQKLNADNEETEKKISALELSNKAEEGRRDTLVKENKDLYKQLEELKKTVNSQVNGLEDILKDGVKVPEQAAAVEAPHVLASVPEYCRCTRACTDLGWGPWCTVQNANCVTKSPCATGGAAGSCVTVDPQDGPWTRCQNIVEPAAASLLQMSSKLREEKADDDDEDADDAKDGKDSDDSDDSDDDEICHCKQPCTDEGWGPWCYVQSATCRVKPACDMGGAANSCVASDPGGPWTRCSNLLSAPVAAPAAPAVAARLAPSVSVPTATAQQDIDHNTKPVKDLLMKMMEQVDDIRQEDEQSAEKLRDLYQQETKRLSAEKDAIAQKKDELATELKTVKEQSAKLATEVEHLEEVNRSLHTQLRRLEHFLASASTELKGSIDTEDHVAAAALQMGKKVGGSKKKASKKADASDDDDDDDNDDDEDA